MNSNKIPRVIVAHPERQHSYRLATALKKEKNLYKYITTVYDKDKSILMKLVKSMLSGNNLKRANGRKCDYLDDEDVIQFCELKGLILILIRKIGNKKIIDLWERYTFNSFGKKVAKYAVKNNVDAVIMYDTNSDKCFEILKSKDPNIIRIMDVSAAKRKFNRDFIEDSMDGDKIDYFKKNMPEIFNPNVLKRLDKEENYVDYFIVPSKFVERSILHFEDKKEKIKHAPYGVDIDKFSYNKMNNKNDDNFIIEFLFVGRVTRLKGVDYLLEAFSEVNSHNVRLKIVGDYSIEPDLYYKYKDLDSIEFIGVVTHDMMANIYKNADIMVIPSLTEGMTLVGLEALASGLPLICTSHTGINDCICDGINGFVIPPANKDIIKEKIEWFVENYLEINRMSESARKTALNYTWNNYEKCINKIIEEITYN